MEGGVVEFRILGAAGGPGRRGPAAASTLEIRPVPIPPLDPQIHKRRDQQTEHGHLSPGFRVNGSTLGKTTPAGTAITPARVW